MPHKDDRLHDIAHNIGVRIIITSKLCGRLNACWHKPTRSIIISKHLDPATARCTLAHELGHAILGHDCSTPIAEREADRWAAKTLLTPAEVHQAAQEVGGHPAAIAAELGVTPHLLATWWKTFTTKHQPFTTQGLFALAST